MRYQDFAAVCTPDNGKESALLSKEPYQQVTEVTILLYQLRGAIY